MRTSLLALALTAGLVSRAPAIAGDFDGRWTADIPKQGKCDIPSVMTVLISGDAIMGEIDRTSNLNVPVAYFTGKLHSPGVATLAFGNGSAGTLRFAGDGFVADWNNGTCERHATGARAPGSAAMAAVAIDRRNHQARYADLIKQAQAGVGPIDYSVLRRESVYAASWDFYDVQASALLDQAAATVKGGDCKSALPLLDQALKLDFTLDSAHALRSDCLRKTGDPEGARVESAIADGLIHSLIDSGADAKGPAGDGADEAHAYVVVTDREEQDVMANRQIQIKERQTQLAGPDGRAFDLIRGVSIRGAARGDVAVQSIYFDITSYTTGLSSKRAAATTAVADIH